jgi:predicted membrane channel-forming protein YqfA (hemolysin III family)
MQNYHWTLRVAGGIIGVTIILQFLRILDPFFTLPLFVIGLILLVVGVILSRQKSV